MIDPISKTDNELIHLVKEKSDSGAFQELINRHSGIYNKIVQQYGCFSDKIQIEELKEDKQYNIYEWIKSYKEDKGMKFSTYVGQMTKFTCLNIMNQTPNQIPLENISEQDQSRRDQNNNSPSKEQIINELEKNIIISDEKFWPIFRARHLGEKPKTWRQIGKENGITYEWARQIYNRYLPRVKDKIEF